MRLILEGVEEGVCQTLENLRANLKWLRGQHGLTNDDMGLLAGVKERQVSVWMNAPITLSPEKGQDSFNPRTANLAKLAEALGIFVGDLYLPPGEFKAKHAGGVRPLVLSARPVSSSLPSSSPSRAASKGGRRRAAGSGNGGSRRRHMFTPAPKVSPFCKPAPQSPEQGAAKAA